MYPAPVNPEMTTRTQKNLLDLLVVDQYTSPWIVEDSETLRIHQEKYEANQYKRNRLYEYPSITDVVVALAEKQEGDDTMWNEITALRQKVKSENPKPK